MSHEFQNVLAGDDTRSRVARVLKCLIKMRSMSDPDAMQTAAICNEIRVSPPTLKKLLNGDIGKVEHLVALTQYLSVKNHEVFLIAESYTTTQDLTYLVTSLMQKHSTVTGELRVAYDQRHLA
ncbi:hypothetical protein [Asticcacaulis sp. W401b]|uniref:hypothetical protein n=1 Tax=Asticcacaulis sp. W401b TaxID=3388666 RepID=UPI0039704737